MGGHTRYKIVIWFREEEDDADSCEFVKDFEAQTEAAPSVVWALVAGPYTVIEGGKTPKGSSEVKAGQEEKSSPGHPRFLATAGLEEKSS